MSNYLPRRVGMSRFHATESLLRQRPTLGQVPESSSPSSSSSSPSSSTGTKARAHLGRASAGAGPETAKMAPKTKTSKPKEPVAFDAPPMSTDDDNESLEEQAGQDSGRPADHLLLDDSEDELAGRGDIRPTKFQPAGASASNGRRLRHAAGIQRTGGQKRHEQETLVSARTTGSRRKRKLSLEAIEDNREEQEEKAASSKLRSASPDHHQTQYGFTKTGKSRLKFKASKKPKGVHYLPMIHEGIKAYSHPASRESIIDNDKDDDSNSDLNGRVDFQPVPGSSSPVKAAEFISVPGCDSPLEQKTFQAVPGEDSPLKAKSFIVPGDDSGPSSPSYWKHIKNFNNRLSDLSEEEAPLANKPKTKKKRDPIIRAPRRKFGVAGARSTRLTKGKKLVDADGSDLEDSLLTSPLAKSFVVPASFSKIVTSTATDVTGAWDSDGSDALSDAPSTISSLSIDELLELDALRIPKKGLREMTTTTTTTTTTLCPWCRAPVEKSLLEEFSKGKRLNVSMQTRFCRSHKRQSALKTWQQRRYPEVDWQKLEGRFARHRDLLLSIIEGGESYYREKLAGRIELGQARDMRKEENLNPGYYGPRGFNLMCDYLVGEFGDLLKEKAVGDKVIAGRGSAAFIQSVLVAELAVQLIREDMSVSVESARDILEESKAVGEMVHEEV